MKKLVSVLLCLCLCAAPAPCLLKGTDSFAEVQGGAFIASMDIVNPLAALLEAEGAWVVAKGLDFGQGQKVLQLRASSEKQDAMVELRLDAPDGQILTTVGVCYNNAATYVLDASSVTGVHDVYVVLLQGNCTAYSLQAVQNAAQYEKTEDKTLFANLMGVDAANVVEVEGAPYLIPQTGRIYKQEGILVDKQFFTLRLLQMAMKNSIILRLSNGENTYEFTKNFIHWGPEGVFKEESIYLENVPAGTYDLEFVFEDSNMMLDRFRFTAADKSNKYAASTTPVRDTYADTWVATDDIGRITPLHGDVGDPNDRKVAMFYFLWHEKDTGEIYDHNTAYLKGGLDGIYSEMAKGPISYSHYWAEPYFGYYRSDDEWIIRKHAQMLVNAGIDFVFFDTSNGILYEHVFFKILKVYQQMRNEGQKTPEFVFFLGDREDFGKAKTEELYELVYKDGLFQDMWFMYNGKPLLLANTTGVTDPEILNFFEIRRSWYNDGGLGKWSWLEHFPQKPGLNPITGEVEQISVGVAEHPSTSRGRSMINGVQITTPEADFEFGLETTPFGLSFDEQWQIAHQYKAPILMICGWNELWAGRWEDEGPYFAGTYVVDASNPRTKNLYVDSFNPEYSRDIEPMKQPMGEGGFGDNYYYQTVQNIRKYKGARPVPKATGYAQISNFASFDNVQPEFRDSLYDTMHRDAMSFANKIHYTNTSGRNDIDIAKVCYDDSYWYFYVKCRENITEPEGENWMNLYIDADQRFATGWKGYDFLINRTSGQTASVEACNGNEYAWNQIGQGEIVRDGNQMYIKIDKNLLNLNPAGFDFKWADNSVKDGKVMEFMDQGDAAPDDRFNFRFEEKAALE